MNIANKILQKLEGREKLTIKDCEVLKDIL